MFYVYILRSIHFKDKTYIGFTSDLEGRLISHNHSSNKGYTKKFAPWKIIYSEPFDTKKEAMDKEKWFKTGIGREWVKKNFLSPSFNLS